LQAALPGGIEFHHGGFERGNSPLFVEELNFRAWGRSPAWTDERPPIILFNFFHQKHFKLPVGPRVASPQPRRNDFGVVQDQNITGSEVFQDVTEEAMGHLLGGTIQDEEAGLIALRKRRLGNQLWRQRVIEIRRKHEEPSMTKGDRKGK
jgi:hypothetical protein